MANEFRVPLLTEEEYQENLERDKRKAYINDLSYAGGAILDLDDRIDAGIKILLEHTGGEDYL
ncbi:MAG: hypothetical protein LBE35_01915 [Clostridiales bacterium]|jgi:hypothetical protein|nr:hypothetical protein [Clostridiales bacterium]